MCDKNCGMCSYFKYTTKENWARSGMCNPPSGSKYNKDFFNSICDEFSQKPHSLDDEDDDFSEREVHAILSQES